MEQRNTVYLAGAITNDPRYKAKFAEAERELTEAGFTVLNPAVLPYPALSYEQYMQIGFAMLDACAALCLLDDWYTSPGARREKERAEAAGKCVFLYGRRIIYRKCHACEHNAPCYPFVSACIECDGISNFKDAAEAAGGNACLTCWCHECMNIAKCLVNGFACYACAEKARNTGRSQRKTASAADIRKLSTPRIEQKSACKLNLAGVPRPGTWLFRT